MDASTEIENLLEAHVHARQTARPRGEPAKGQTTCQAYLVAGCFTALQASQLSSLVLVSVRLGLEVLQCGLQNTAAGLERGTMTRPKKWYLDEESISEADPEGAATPTRRGIVLKNSEGLLKKPNAIQPLGRINSVSTSDSADGILVCS